MDGPDHLLGLASTQFSEQDAVFPPVLRGCRGLVSRLVKEAHSLVQALDDVPVNSGLVGRGRVQLVHGPGLREADPAVHHPQAPQMQDVVEGQHVGHDGGDEAGAVTLMLELPSDFLGTVPQLRTQQDGLREVPDVDWHAGLLGMSEGTALAMRVVDEQVLVEEDWIEHRDVLDSHQVLVTIEGLASVVAGAVVAQPLQ